MVRPLVTSVFIVLAAASADAAPTVRTMYMDAMAKEEAVRAALADPAATESDLKSVRAAVDQYEALVRRYPASSYSDDALWQAGRLSIEAFTRFGQARDQDTGIRLLRMLQKEYPASKLAKLVPAQLAGRPAPQPGAAHAAEPAPPRQSTAETKPAVAPAVSGLATIKGIRRVIMPDVVRVVIEIDKEVPFHEERISGPSRIFVDFGSTRTAPSLVDQTLRFDGDSDVVRQVRIGRHPNQTRVVLDATGVSSYSVYPLYSPYRLVIDCVRSAATPAPPVSSSAAPPAAVRTAKAAIELSPLVGRRLAGQAGRWPPRVTPSGTAMLLDARTAASLDSRSLGAAWQRRLPSVAPGGARDLVDAYTPNLLASRSLRHEWDRPLPFATPAAGAMLADAGVFAAEPRREVDTSAAVAAAEPKSAAASPTSPGFSMARQLGLGVSRIVIDPGHGGHDPGAKSKSGVTESELVLDVAQRLQHLLEAVPGVEVILTRQTDDFVSLQERTAIANREGADLFLSIHANANANSQARGIETYFLNFANNLNAGQVAARENAASGQAMGALPDFVKAIALHNKLDESRDFATLVQRAMVERLRPANKTIRNLGVKQAPFVVLIGASMPSALAEISFLTNPQEGKLLKSDAYRDRIADALFTGIRTYQSSLSRVQTVAHQ